MAVTGTTTDAMAALWAQVLGVPGIGADDDLAGLGVDSLDTARVVSRIRRTYGIDVPFRVVFEAATPRALADALVVPGGGALVPARGPDAVADRALWPLSHDQQRLWLLDNRTDNRTDSGDAGGSVGYHLTVILRLTGDLDRTALERAWADVVARHGSLRTRFALDRHEPRQEVLASWPTALPVTELAEADLPDRVAELATPAFDLAAAPPWRAALHRLGPDEHALVLVIHHIIFDGWSEEVLRRELSELYAAHRAGRPADLPPLTVRYTDHAVWQREQADGGSGVDTQLDYWRTQLAGSAQLDLPADRARPQTWTGAGADHDFVIDARLAAEVRALARAAGATPFMTLLAAWAALLGRLCDTDDVVLGASTADRGRPELEDLVGMFVNVLVIRTRLGRHVAVGDLLAAVRETTLDAFANRDVPFERLVAELAPDRAASHNPLFNVNFVYLNMPAADETWPGLTVRRLTLPASTTAFDLILAVQDQPDGTLRCHLEYSTDLFDHATIDRIGRCYERLLAGFVADQDIAVDAVDLLDADERGRLVAAATGAPVPLPAHCLHHAVEAHVRSAPTAVAVACGDVELTYADLDVRANRLATYLRGHGVGPGIGVAVRLPRSADQVVAMLAVWKAGGYYVPLDDEHPAERIAMMLADAAPLVLVTRGASRVAAGESAGGVKVVCLERDAADVATQPATAPAGVGVGQRDLAAAIYTSGSTGMPKAVALTHRNVLSAEVSREALGAQPVSLLLPVSFAFDVFLSFAAWALCAGGRVVVPVQPRGADLDELAGLLRSQRVTHLVAPPDLQRALLARPDVHRDVRGNHLVIGVVGGQSCPRQLAEDYAAATDGARLVNEYGATETSAGTYFVTDGRDLGAGPGQLPIGRPIANYTVHVLDAHLEPVLDGVAAEVFIGGPGVARGYLRRPALTADRFLPDPFATEPGSRLYRTGDLARRRSDGELEFLGRRDRQVKVRGHRIEPAEVEAALLRHASVAAAAVVHVPQRQELVAYVVASATGTAPTGDELRDHLKRLLPDPMVPAAFGVLPALPLTPNGKVDRAALAELDVASAAQEPEVPHTAPRTPAERTVAEVWAEVMAIDVDGIDVHADFFKIGGHSLLAAGVVSRLRAGFPVPVGMRDLFTSPTVAGLAELIGARMLESLQSQFGQQVTAAPVAPPAVEVAVDRLPPAEWNDTGRDYDLVPLGRMFTEQVAATPDAPAVWADGRWSSYAEFATRVHRLAAHLRRGPLATAAVDRVVGICLPRGADLVTAVHAVTAAGAAYLPLPPDLPASRLAMMTEDARPTAVITTDEFAGLFDGTPLVRLDADREAIETAPAERVEVDVPLDALAYVIFTSGSTGRPKGVGVSHRAIANRLVWTQETFGLTAADRVLHKTPFSFDVSVCELYWPLLTGAGLVVVDDGGHRDLGRLAEIIGATGVTVAQFVPSILAMFVDEPGTASLLSSLRRVLAAGEALSADLVARFRAALPHVELHNLYGPTEAAVYATWHMCDGSDAVVPIGRPLADTRLDVLDPDGERLPIGVSGELYLGGAALARGYLNRPGLTAERFVPDPDRPGHRLYRTGDLARWRADGTVEYLGRIDHQVKIRGVRIEPAEVEAALRAHPAVGGAVVTAWAPGAGELRLVAHLVCEAGRPAPTPAELRAFLGTRLPTAMIPTRYTVLPRFPLTPSGKLDRAALPAPDEVDRSLVWLGGAGAAPPLFCVHPGDGATHWYSHLADAIGGDRPVASFAWPREHGAPPTIEGVALRYLGELRAARPTGPYHLLGWCGGTAVTWELARLLHAAGERVRLWLLDPLVDVAQRPVSAQQLVMFQQSETLFAALDGEDGSTSGTERADVVEFVRLSIGDEDVAVTEEDVRTRARAGRELLEASLGYDFPPYDGHLELLIGDEIPDAEHVVMSGQGYQQYLDRWRELAVGGMRVHRVGGDHYGAVRPPHVAELARLIAATRSPR